MASKDIEVTVKHDGNIYAARDIKKGEVIKLPDDVFIKIDLETEAEIKADPRILSTHEW